jgi:outer membrane protein TolC
VRLTGTTNVRRWRRRRRLSASRVASLIFGALWWICASQASAHATSTIARAVITLDEAIERARTRSEEAVIERERVTIADIEVGRAWTLLKPTLSASYNFAHVEPRPPPFELPGFPNFNTPDVHAACDNAAPGDVGCLRALYDSVLAATKLPPTRYDFFRANTSLFSAAFNWNVLNGRALPLIENAYDSLQLAQDRASSLMLDFLLTVARAYYAAAATQQGTRAAERALGRAQEELRIVQSHAEAGEGIRSRLVAARIAVSQAETDIKRARNAHQQTLDALAFLTRSPERPDVAPPPKPTPPIGARDELLAMAMKNRQELHAASTAVVIADRSKDEVWWRLAPTVSLFGGYRYSNVAGIAGLREQWTAGINATVLLYDGGLRYQDLREVDSKIRLAEATLETVKAQIDSEVSRAVLRLEAADMTIDRAKDALALAQEHMKLARAEYEAGALRMIEVQQANDDALDAELSLIRAQMDRSVAILELQRAIGTFAP